MEDFALHNSNTRMLIHKLVSDYISSNTYIIEFATSDKVVLIDCGILDARSIIEWLSANNKSPSHVILTHADADHVAGVNSLASFYEFILIASKNCSIAIKSRKKNFSKYIEIFNGGFTIEKTVFEVNDEEFIDINGKSFQFIHTPGHTKACMCIKVENLLFSGDTIIKGIKTRINIRAGGSKIELKNSIDKLTGVCNSDTLLYPGHGDSCTLKSTLNYIL